MTQTNWKRFFSVASNVLFAVIVVYFLYELYLRFAPIDRQYCQEPMSHRPQVLLLGTSWCPFCRKATRFLQSEAVEFCELDIEKSALGAKLHDESGATGIPVFLIGDYVVQGMDNAAVLKALAVSHSNPQG